MCPKVPIIKLKINLKNYVVTLKGRFIITGTSAYVTDVIARSVFESHVISILLIGHKAHLTFLAFGYVLFQVTFFVHVQRPLSFEMKTANLTLEFWFRRVGITVFEFGPESLEFLHI